MFNVRPDAFWPWLYVKPPSDDPSGFRVAADGSVRDAGVDELVSCSAVTVSPSMARRLPKLSLKERIAPTATTILSISSIGEARA